MCSINRLILPLFLSGFVGLLVCAGCRAKPGGQSATDATGQVFPPGNQVELEVDAVPAVYIFTGSRDLKLDPDKT